MLCCTILTLRYGTKCTDAMLPGKLDDEIHSVKKVSDFWLVTGKSVTFFYSVNYTMNIVDCTTYRRQAHCREKAQTEITEMGGH
jgi:hypothetical protein